MLQKWKFLIWNDINISVWRNDTGEVQRLQGMKQEESYNLAKWFIWVPQLEAPRAGGLGLNPGPGKNFFLKFNNNRSVTLITDGEKISEKAAVT